MKKYALIILIFIAVSMSACKSDSDVLATFTGGQITRGQLYEMMDIRKMPKDAILKKKSQQKNKLERMALQELIVIEAKKEGYDKTEDYKYIMGLAKRNFYAGYLGTTFRKDFEFKEDAAKVRIIKLLVKNYKIANNKRVTLTGGELEEAFAEKMKKGEALLKELKDGASFEELAKKNSDDFSKNKGGDIGYITSGMRGEDFSKAVFAMKEGEFSKAPLKIGNAIYLIKVEDKKELTKDNIEDVVTDKKQASALKKRIMMSSIRDYQMKLMKAEDIENNIEKAPMGNANALLFKVGNNEFKVADLNKVISYVVQKRQGMGYKAMNFNEKMKRDMATRIFREEVLMREALKKGVDKKPEFANQLKYFSKFNLSRSYETDKILTGIAVTAAEVQEEYNKNRDKMYTRFENKGGKKVKKIIPFNKVKDSIEYRLLNQKRAKQRNVWEKNLLKQNKYTVIESELEGE